MNVHRLVAHLILKKYESCYVQEQVLRGALAARREKEAKITTTSLEFEYLHRKSLCDMIGGDDISKDVITLATCFSMFVHICAGFRLALIGGNLKAQSTGSHRGIGGGIQIPGTYLQALLHFPLPPPEPPGELAPRLVLLVNETLLRLKSPSSLGHRFC